MVSWQLAERKEAAVGDEFVSRINEVVNIILAGDWQRYGASDGSSYYVVGDKAFWADLAEGNVGTVHSAPRAKSPAWKPREPLAEKYARELTASDQPEYRKDAFKRLKEAGVDRTRAAEAAARLLSSDPDWAGGLESSEQVNAVAQFIEVAIADGAIPSASALPGEADQYLFALQRLYLYEAINKYRKLCRRIGRLAPLPFQDRQLEEATRCWLYGFYRAAIVLAAAALEHLLKTITDTVFSASFPALVEKAKKDGKICEPYSEQATEVYEKRNDVVHRGIDPRAEDAEEVLVKVRGIMSSILPPVEDRP